MAVEVWNYDPELLSENGRVDDISLLLSLEMILMKGYRWDWMRLGKNMDFRLKMMNDKEPDMINGMDLFREHFADYKDQYTIIGGFAVIFL